MKRPQPNKKQRAPQITVIGGALLIVQEDLQNQPSLRKDVRIQPCPALHAML